MMNSSVRGESQKNLSAAILILIVAVSAFVVHGISLVVFIKSQMRLTNKLMFGHLSVVYLMMIVISQPFIITSVFLNHFPFNDIWIQILGLIYFVCVFLSMYNVMFMVVDRYILVCHEAKYKVWVTPTRAIFLIIFSWLFWLITTALMFISKPTMFYYERRLFLCMMHINASVFSFHIVAGPVVTTSVITYCYIRIIKAVMTLNTVGTTQGELRQVNRTDVQNPRSDGKKRKSAIFVSGFLMIFSVPMIPLIVAIPITVNEKEALPNGQWMTLVVFLGLFFNSLFYIISFQPFKKAFKDLFCKSYVRKQRRKELLAKLTQGKPTIQNH